jgi:hypothetical protein
MNDWMRTLKLVYRREPILSFLVTAGAVNVAIGGLSEHWSLVSVGLSVVGVAIALGVRQQMQPRRHSPMRVPKRRSLYALPPSAEELPLLRIAPKNPPSP